MTLQTAYIEDLSPTPRASAVRAQFNPAELTFSKTATMAEIAIPGLDQPVLQFVRGGAETVTLDLFFDSTEKGMGDDAVSVCDHVDKFYQLVTQDPDLHAPPVCKFSWGAPDHPGTKAGVSHAPFWFICIVESVDRKFTLWSTKGLPLRARVTVKLREYQTVEEMVAKLKSADHTKARSLKRRERLDQIAAQEYGSPAEWRRIANKNHIDDPRRIDPGTLLELPPMRIGSVIGKAEA
jgi:hypothetical protein